MRITIGFTLDYDDVGALMRLRNFFKGRVRLLYRLMANILSAHYRALTLRNRYNIKDGEALLITINIPPYRWHFLRGRIRGSIITLYYRYRIWRGDFVCADCNEWSDGDKHDVGWVNYHGQIGWICHECYHQMHEEWLQAEIAHYAGG